MIDERSCYVGVRVGSRMQIETRGNVCGVNGHGDETRLLVELEDGETIEVSLDAVVWIRPKRASMNPAEIAASLLQPELGAVS